MSDNRLLHDRLVNLAVAVAVFNVLCLAAFVGMERFGVMIPSSLYLWSTVSAHLMAAIAFHLWYWFHGTTQSLKTDDELPENP